MKRSLSLLVWAVVVAPCAVAQEDAGALEVGRAVAPDTVTVGDPFRSVLRVLAPPGSRVEFGGVPRGDSLQSVAPVRALPSASGSGAAAMYSLVPWVAGTPLEVRVRVRVVRPGGEESVYQVPLGLPVVRSVLPADASEARPRPGRGVLPLPERAPLWPWLLAVGLLALAAAAGWWRWRRPTVVAPPRRDPRDEALAELRRIGEAGWGRGEAAARQLSAVSRVLRRYLARVAPEWGEEWTTTELLQRISPAEVGSSRTAEIAGLLRRADRVKFAGEVPAPEETARYAAVVRAWIESFPPPAAPEQVPREAA